MLRVISVWTGKPGSPWYSTLNFEGSGSVDAAACVEAVDEMMRDILGQQVSPIQTQTDPFVASVDPATGLTVGGFVTEPAAAATASNATDMAPAASQILISLRTGAYVGGKEIRGKMYLPGIQAVNTTSEGRVDPSFVSTFSNFLTTYATSGPQWVVYSRKNNATYPVSRAVCSPEWAVLRSRRD